MLKKGTYIFLFLAILTLMMGVSGHGDETDEVKESDVQIVQPSNQAIVPPTFSLDFTVPEGDSIGLFLLIDTDPIPTGNTIPSDGHYIHIEQGAAEYDLTLPIGEHQLTIQAGDHYNNALDYSQTITVNVVEDAAVRNAYIVSPVDGSTVPRLSPS